MVVSWTHTIEEEGSMVREAEKMHPLFSQVLLAIFLFSGASSTKGFGQNLEKFFCSVDREGDGEIRHNEAKEFIGDFRRKESNTGDFGCGDAKSDPFLSHSFTFSYGGVTICAGEMHEHLQTMLTTDRVAEWIAHGLQLPQYAPAFHQNGVTGLDFPYLIDNEGLAVAQELGVRSVLHRKKITHALVRQIFGMGTFPGPPQHLSCQYSCADGFLLQWRPPSSRGHPPLHKYVIQRWDNASRTWVSNVNETEDTSFLDGIMWNNGKWHSYSYRVRAWSGYGPSEWVTVHGCAASDGQEAVDVRLGQLASEQWAKLCHATSLPFSWMYMLNIMLVVLGVLARTRYSYRYFMALLTFLHSKAFGEASVRFSHGGAFDYPVMRKLSRYINLAWTRFMLIFRSKCRRSLTYDSSEATYDLESRNSVRNKHRRNLGCADSPTSVEESMGKKSFVARRNSITCSSSICSISSHRHGSISAAANMTEDDLSSGSKKSRMKLIDVFGGSFRGHDDPRKLSKQHDTCRMSFPSRCDILGSVSMDDKRDVAWEGSWRASKSFRLPRSSWGHSRKRARSTCSFEGCRSRFDRFLSLSDWRMKLNRHYCCHCQLMYCVEHTRFCPHGLFGRCGLDSACLCLSCFEDMPTETRQKLHNVPRKPPSRPAIDSSLFFFARRKRQKTKVEVKMVLESSSSAESLLAGSSSGPSPSTTIGDGSTTSTTSNQSSSSV